MNNVPQSDPVAMRLLRRIWSNRHRVLLGIRAAGYGLSWLYDKFPLPKRVKEITTELTYHCIEHLIVQSDGYQQWLQRRNGLSHLHHLFRLVRDEDVDPVSVVPTDTEWQHCIEHFTRHDHTTIANVAVIVPVYKGYDETMRCIYQLLTARNEIRFHITVINDCSPDAKLVQALQQLHDKGLFEFIHHAKNQGFVRSVNAGMTHHPSRDVVLLNADTEVYDGWLDRLMAALYSRNDIASATPFSNNAELCSYPQSFRSNHTPLEIDYAALDRLAGSLDPAYPEIPTAVGFCMAIRRKALDQIGLFDDDLFGRGYGEENDWCLRAAEKGWYHVLAPNVFVRHTGSVSFEAQKRRELNRSLRKLNARHPHYRQLVRRFRHADPLLDCRRQLDLARISHQCFPTVFLMISHNIGGGTEKHIHDMVQWLRQEHISVVRISPDSTHASRLVLWHADVTGTPNLSFDIDTEQDALQHALEQLGISHIHVHHLLGFPQSMSYWIMRTAAQLGIQYDVTFHDYFFACPSINLITNERYFTQNPTLEDSQQWANKHPSAAGRTPVWVWRDRHRQLLCGARTLIAPSEDTATRMQHFFPNLAIIVKPHPEHRDDRPALTRIRQPHERLEIAIIGQMAKHKGYDLVLALGQDAMKRNLPILFHIFGAAEPASALRKTGQIVLHGRYEESEIYALLRMHRCHLAFTPSVWPETYSYTLSIALQYGLYPVCFDMGAPAERIRKLSWGALLSTQMIQHAGELNDALLAIQTAHAPDTLSIERKGDLYPSLINDYYELTSQLAQITPIHKHQQG